MPQFAAAHRHPARTATAAPQLARPGPLRPHQCRRVRINVDDRREDAEQPYSEEEDEQSGG